MSDFEAVMSAGYSVSLMTSWSGPAVSRLWIKMRLVDGAKENVSATHLGAAPAAQPSAVATPEVMQRLYPFGVAGPWSERLPHFRPDVVPGPAGHLQSEYLVPRARATAAIAKLRSIGDRIDRHLWATEIRSIAGDTLWLSPSYGDDRVGIHFSWRREPGAVREITAEIEAMLLPFGARPHWGKIMHARAGQLAPLYPKLPSFRELVGVYDPGGKFRNEFLDVHVLG
jgi:alditol oxidase